MQRRSSLNKRRPLPGIKSPTEDEAPKDDGVDGHDEHAKTDAVETAATAAAESKSQTTTGPKTTAYKLKELPLAEVIGEVEVRINRLKTLDKYSTSDCSDDLNYLNAATRCGSNPEVNFVIIRCSIGKTSVVLP